MTAPSNTDRHEKDLAALRRTLRGFKLPVSDSMGLREMTKLLRLDYDYSKYHREYNARQSAIKDISKVVFGFRQSDSPDDLLIQMCKIIQGLK